MPNTTRLLPESNSTWRDQAGNLVRCMAAACLEADQAEAVVYQTAGYPFLNFVRRTDDFLSGQFNFVSASGPAAGRCSSVWQHRSTGGLYRKLDVALLLPDGQPVVVYQSLAAPQTVWVRDMVRFDDGRFEEVGGLAA